jgi:predicted adenylyl cyclase CyaB
MREIEILVRILEPKINALKKLSRFKIHHISNISDQYYHNPIHKGFLPTMKKNSSEMIRTRIKDGKHYFTYKKDVFTKSGWAYSDEYETEVKDAKVIDAILRNLEFLPLVKVVNKRTIYYFKTFEICLEEVKGLGLFMEIECITPGKRSSEKIRDEILELINDIGIKVTEESKMGKGELLYRKKHRL